ncbi:MAG: aminopeptidase, partial [Gammaproteobacteria bacterium]
MNEISADRLKYHVTRLAGDIGEHNVFYPEALNTAERYITEEWRSQGFEVTPQTYAVRGVP